MTTKRDCYIQMMRARKRGHTNTAKNLKDLYIYLVTNQVLVLNFPLFHN